MWLQVSTISRLFHDTAHRYTTMLVTNTLAYYKQKNIACVWDKNISTISWNGVKEFLIKVAIFHETMWKSIIPKHIGQLTKWSVWMSKNFSAAAFALLIMIELKLLQINQVYYWRLFYKTYKYYN